MRKILLIVMLFALALSITQVYNVQAEETLIWSGDVSSSGGTTTGPVLDAFIQYHVVAKGIFYYSRPSYLAADAQYYTTDPVHDWNWYNHFPAPGGHSFLQIDEEDVDWGPFSNGVWVPDQGDFIVGHEYSIYYEATGAAITFRVIDWIDGNYTNNNCHFGVEIYSLPLSTGYTPGFWKHNIGVALGYNNGAYSAFRDGTKLTAEMLQTYAATVGVTLKQAYQALTARGPHMDTVRADMANAFNTAAGFGPFIDED
jgi:hypothetical protein